MAFARVFALILLLFPASASADNLGVGLIDTRDFPTLPNSTLQKFLTQNPGECRELQRAVDHFISDGFHAIATNISCDGAEDVFQGALDAGLQVVIFEPVVGHLPAPNSLPDAIRIGFGSDLNAVAIASLENGLGVSREKIRDGGIYTWCPFEPDLSGLAAAGKELPLSISFCPQIQVNTGDMDLTGYLNTVTLYLDAMNTHLVQQNSFDGFDPTSIGLPDGVVVNGQSLWFPPRLTIMSRPDLPIPQQLDGTVAQIQHELDPSKIKTFLDSMLTDHCPNCGANTTTCETTCPSRCNNSCSRCGSDSSGFTCSTSGIILP